MTSIRRLPAALILSAATLVSMPAGAADDILITDLVGNWKNDISTAANPSLKLMLSKGELDLETSWTTEWKPVTSYNPARGFSFQHIATKEDLQKGILDNQKRPEAKSDEAIAAALEKLALHTDFSAVVSRSRLASVPIVGDSCVLYMKVTERGWHYGWDEKTKAFIEFERPIRESNFTQVAYALPDLKTHVVETSFLTAPGLLETHRETAGADINFYFTEKGAYRALGELALAMLKPVIAGAQAAVPAETLVGKLVEGVITTAIEKSLQGEVELKDFANAVVKTYLGHVLEELAEKPPFDGIVEKLQRVTLETAGTAAGVAQDKALSQLEVQKLEELLASHCRFELVNLWTNASVGAAVAIVDKKLGVADIFLFMPKKGSRPALIVRGRGSIPEKDAKPAVTRFAFQLVGN
jgi:hypothetical protein